MLSPPSHLHSVRLSLAPALVLLCPPLSLWRRSPQAILALRALATAVSGFPGACRAVLSQVEVACFHYFDSDDASLRQVRLSCERPLLSRPTSNRVPLFRGSQAAADCVSRLPLCAAAKGVAAQWHAMAMQLLSSLDRTLAHLHPRGPSVPDHALQPELGLDSIAVDRPGRLRSLLNRMDSLSSLWSYLLRSVGLSHCAHHPDPFLPRPLNCTTR